MEIKINTNISNEFDDITITVNAPNLSEETQNVIKYISNITTVPNKIIATKDYKIYLIDLKKIICFFSKEKSNYIKTKHEIYKINYKLYEIEKMLSDNEFIRISKSCIINVNQVECFDTSMLGTIIVKLNDGTQESVSKRNVSALMKFLKERR